MVKVERRDLGLPVNPPFAWDEHDSSRYTLEEIADEFMNVGRRDGLG